MTGEALRESNTEKLEHKLTPDSQQGLGTKLQDAADNAASFVPGQEKTRDHFTDNAKSPHLTHDTGRLGGGEAFKPDSQQTLGDKAKQTFDQVTSAIQPTETKSKTQEARDAITPGNHSATQQDGKGVIAQAGDAIVGAKDAVVNALSGGSKGAHGGATGPTH